MNLRENIRVENLRMNDSDLESYCAKAIERGVNHAIQIHPSSVVTAPWVRMKCQFGCGGYGQSYCCPPNTPTPEETREVIDSYRRAILFHTEFPATPDRGKRRKRIFEMLTDLEGEIFKDGYYKALVFLAGPCPLCKSCAKLDGSPCKFGSRARPSMEACGIDVFQTARNNGLFVKTLRDKSETQSGFCLMLVD